MLTILIDIGEQLLLAFENLQIIIKIQHYC